MFDLRQIQVFLAVWKTRSFTKAAKEIHLTQPTVSGHIKALEDALGIQLFDRSGRKAVPTKAGEAFYPHARQIMRLFDKARRTMDTFCGGDSGELEVGGSNIPGQYILPLLIGRFKEGRPNCRIVLRIDDTSGIVSQVEHGELELGMVGGVVKRNTLHFEPCLEDRLLLVMPPGHRLAGKVDVSVEEILEEPFVAREVGSGSRMAAERALRDIGIEGFQGLNVVAEMGSTEAVRQAVKAGVGLAFISERAVKEDMEHGLLASATLEEMTLERSFYLVWHAKRSLSPLAEAFRDFVMEGEAVPPCNPPSGE